MCYLGSDIYDSEGCHIYITVQGQNKYDKGPTIRYLGGGSVFFSQTSYFFPYFSETDYFFAPDLKTDYFFPQLSSTCKQIFWFIDKLMLTFNFSYTWLIRICKYTLLHVHQYHVKNAYPSLNCLITTYIAYGAITHSKYSVWYISSL